MSRTNKQTAVERKLTGVREVGLDLGDRINEIHGMYDEPLTSLQRVPGKILACTGLMPGPVWGLHQLRFRDSMQLVIHADEQFLSEREQMPFSGRWFPYPDYPVPPTSEILLPDWPEGWYQIVWSPNASLPPSSPQYARGYTVSVSPLALSFIVPEGSRSESQEYIWSIRGVWPMLELFNGMWETTVVPAWVSLSAGAQDSAEEFLDWHYDVVANATDLAPGTYETTVIVVCRERKSQQVVYLSGVVVTVRVLNISLAVLPTSMLFEVDVGDSENQTLAITNDGEYETNWVLVLPSITGLSASLLSGTLGVGGSQNVTITYAPTGGDEDSGGATVTDDHDDSDAVAITTRGYAGTAHTPTVDQQSWYVTWYVHLFCWAQRGNDNDGNWPYCVPPYTLNEISYGGAGAGDWEQCQVNQDAHLWLVPPAATPYPADQAYNAGKWGTACRFYYAGAMLPRWRVFFLNQASFSRYRFRVPAGVTQAEFERLYFRFPMEVRDYNGNLVSSPVRYIRVTDVLAWAAYNADPNTWSGYIGWYFTDIFGDSTNALIPGYDAALAVAYEMGLPNLWGWEASRDYAAFPHSAWNNWPAADYGSTSYYPAVEDIRTTAVGTPFGCSLVTV